jgi:hypothetical protein
VLDADQTPDDVADDPLLDLPAQGDADPLAAAGRINEPKS